MHNHNHDNSSKNIATAFYLNFFFAIVELVGGFLTGSVAILADAVHDLGDCLSLGIAWFLQRLSHKGKTPSFSYGYGRLSLLSALLSGLIISIGSFFIIVETVPRFFIPSPPHGKGMLLIAIFGICVNLIATIRLSKGKSMNEKMLQWHFVEDILGWVAILIGSLFIIWKGWYWIDPLLAVLVSTYVIWNMIKNLKKTIKLFLQSVPEDFSKEDFQKKAIQINGIKEIHDLHIWSLDGTNHILSLHAIIDSNKNSPRIKKEIRIVAKSMGNYHTTIELEFSEENCPETGG